MQVIKYRPQYDSGACELVKCSMLNELVMKFIKKNGSINYCEPKRWLPCVRCFLLLSLNDPAQNKLTNDYLYLRILCGFFSIADLQSLSHTHSQTLFFSFTLLCSRSQRPHTDTNSKRERKKHQQWSFAMSSQANTHIRGIKRLTQHTNTCERIPRTITTTTKTRCSLQQYKFWFKWLARIRNCEFFGKNLTQSKIRTHLSRLFFLCLWQNGLCLAYLFLIASHLQCSKWSESEKELRPKKKNRTNVRRPNLIGYL